MRIDFVRWKGRLNRWLGLTTGDREGEARGVVQERTGHNPDEREQHAATRVVKAQHHDYGEPERR